MPFITSMPRAAVLGTAILATTVPYVRPAGADARRDAPIEVRVGCAQTPGQVMGACAATVAHGEDARTTVTVTFPNGFARVLFFEAGTFLRANPTMSGTGTDIDWRIEGDRLLLRVEGQRYELPAALVAGG